MLTSEGWRFVGNFLGALKALTGAKARTFFPLYGTTEVVP